MRFIVSAAGALAVGLAIGCQSPPATPPAPPRHGPADAGTTPPAAPQGPTNAEILAKVDHLAADWTLEMQRAAYLASGDERAYTDKLEVGGWYFWDTCKKHEVVKKQRTNGNEFERRRREEAVAQTVHDCFEAIRASHVTPPEIGRTYVQATVGAYDFDHQLFPLRLDKGAGFQGAVIGTSLILSTTLASCKDVRNALLAVVDDADYPALVLNGFKPDVLQLPVPRDAAEKLRKQFDKDSLYAEVELVFRFTQKTVGPLPVPCQISLSGPLNGFTGDLVGYRVLATTPAGQEQVLVPWHAL